MFPVHLLRKAYSICLILAGTPFSKSAFCTCETLIALERMSVPSTLMLRLGKWT